MEMFLIYPVFIGIGIATAELAHQRGYSARWWFLWGLLLPVISHIVLFSLKKKPKSTTGYHAPVNNMPNDKVLYKRPE